MCICGSGQIHVHWICCESLSIDEGVNSLSGWLILQILFGCFAMSYL